MQLPAIFRRTKRADPLPPQTEREIELMVRLREALANPSRGLTPNPSPQPQWQRNIDRLVELACAHDPRDFLTWDVVRDTMFVGDEPYVAEELSFLQSLGDWDSRWGPAIEESAARRPPRYSGHPTSSGNLIHHAYHLARFESASGYRVEDHEVIVEFGGGYGSTCRLIERLGFSGKYIIYDLPAFSALQRYYLSSIGLEVSPDSTPEEHAMVISCEHDLDQVRYLIGAAGAAGPADKAEASVRRLFIGEWSISETPPTIRDRFLPLTLGFDSHLIAYQSEFGGVDNTTYFATHADRSGEIEWSDSVIPHLSPVEEHHYLFGWRPRSDS